MSVNLGNLELTIQRKINTTLDSDEILMLTKALTAMKTGQLASVTTFSALPSIASVPKGTLYLVTSEERIYVAEKTAFNIWKLLIDDTVGQAWVWGLNSNGFLQGSIVGCTSSPVSLIGNVNDWISLSSNFDFAVGIRENKTLWSWGSNSNGELGDKTTIDKSSPVSVVGGFTDWCQVSAGESHTTAVRTNGTLWAWGYNGFGRLGDNTTIDKSSPVSVVGGFTDWCQVSTGGQHTAAVRTNGTLWSWGFGSQGRLGDGTEITRSSPVSVVGGFTDWCQVSATVFHTAAVRTNGTLWSWGYNIAGRLGDGTATNRSSPVSVVGGFTDWCQVSAGFGHTAAVRTNGTLWAWGCNFYGQLGDGTATISRLSPVSVVGGFTDWCQVSAGQNHTAAIRTNGTLWSWGNNSNGKLGDGTTISRSSPVSVIGGFTDWCQINAAGFAMTGLRRRTF